MINVAVMFGGRSVEHDVSIISAVQAMEQFDKRKYKVFPVYITKTNEFYYGEALRSVRAFTNKEELFKQCTRVVFTKDSGIVEMLTFPWNGESGNVITTLDVAFPIVHGTNVEDGILQGFLKTLDIPFVGCDVLSSAVGMDKYVMKVLLKEEGFPVLDGKRYSKYEYKKLGDIVENIKKRFAYPVIIKPVNLGSSVGISKAHNDDELNTSVANAFKYSSTILVERALEHIKEINCSVLGNQKECIVSECEEPLTDHEFLDFDEKYIAGATKSGSKGMKSLRRKIPADISLEMKVSVIDISSRVFKCLGCCGVVRIDYMIDLESNKLYLNEVNTIPGSLAFYLWEPVGLDYPELLDRLIDLAIDRYNEEKSVQYEFESSILSNMSINK